MRSVPLRVFLDSRASRFLWVLRLLAAGHSHGLAWRIADLSWRSRSHTFWRYFLLLGMRNKQIGTVEPQATPD